LLRVDFIRRDHHWRIRNVRPIAASDIPPQHQEFAVQATTEYFMGRRLRARKLAPRYNLAILHDPDNPEPASNAKALQKFEKAAQALGIHVEFITKADYGRLTEFDALFIRDTTFVNHYTYRFSRRAAAEGLVVIDDPNSILKCNNKVYLAEILERYRIPAPKTLLVHRDNVNQIITTLGLPCVLKQPDSSFSVGVVKVETEQELPAKVNGLLDKSELIVAQEYLPTEFDWRVGIIDRRPLFVAKYFMVPGHWQNHQARRRQTRFRRGKNGSTVRRRGTRPGREDGAQGGQTDRRRILRRRHQADRQAPLRHRDQRQSQRGCRQRGQRAQGRALPRSDGRVPEAH